MEFFVHSATRNVPYLHPRLHLIIELCRTFPIGTLVKRHSLFNPLHADLLLSNLLCFCCRLLIFFKIYFFKIFFQKHYQNVKRFHPHQVRCYARPDLGPNLFALQRVSSNDTVAAYMGRVVKDSSSCGIEIVIT